MLWSSSKPDPVGREHELSALGEALDATLSGRGAGFLILGEPGIGKTHTVRAFSTCAASAGMLVLWAQIPEHPGILPYWPWVRVLRQLTQLLDEQELRRVLGLGASCIADICPELRDRLPDLPLAQPFTDPEQARFQLFDAMAQAWRRLAARRAVLLIFDDLHWADVSSVHLLEFCTGEIADSRALIVATARDAGRIGPAPGPSCPGRSSAQDGPAQLDRPYARTDRSSPCSDSPYHDRRRSDRVRPRQDGWQPVLRFRARALAGAGRHACRRPSRARHRPCRSAKASSGRYPRPDRHAPESPLGDHEAAAAERSGDRRAVQLRSAATSVRRPRRGPVACRTRSSARCTYHRRAERAGSPTSFSMP